MVLTCRTRIVDVISILEAWRDESTYLIPSKEISIIDSYQGPEATLSYEGGASPASLSNPDTSRSYCVNGEGGRDGGACEWARTCDVDTVYDGERPK